MKPDRDLELLAASALLLGFVLLALMAAPLFLFLKGH